MEKNCRYWILRVGGGDFWFNSAYFIIYA